MSQMKGNQIISESIDLIHEFKRVWLTKQSIQQFGFQEDRFYGLMMASFVIVFGLPSVITVKSDTAKVSLQKKESERVQVSAIISLIEKVSLFRRDIQLLEENSDTCRALICWWHSWFSCHWFVLYCPLICCNLDICILTPQSSVSSLLFRLTLSYSSNCTKRLNASKHDHLTPWPFSSKHQFVRSLSVTITTRRQVWRQS